MIPRKHKELLQTIGTYADKLGLKAWVVGGAVRDFYLKKDTKDLDLTFEGSPESVAGFCIRTWGGEKRKFSQFNTYRVTLSSGMKLDLVQARKETYARPGALPEVTPSNIKDDLFRRDFTANAWALSISPKNFGASYDPFGAQKAIDGGFLKILHERSFSDDPTRLYRIVRFAGRFGWSIERKTAQLLQDAVRQEYPFILSRERVRQELVKILSEKNVCDIFALLQKYDLTPFLYPGIKWGDEIAKGKTVEAKLGILACLLASSGPEFLMSLHLPKELTHELLGAWSVFDSQKSPAAVLTSMQEEIVRAMCPGLKRTALEPCFIKGRDLRDLGMSGRKISATMERFSKLQWAGRISSREQALSFLE
ncbi:MAG: CCA tRNA nucleotidyltransferase [Elusimicrobiaceae bacterium]|nr:CCA tRNA nucleotidyltransferase [Elusimicrobiaceae bacterium]